MNEMKELMKIILLFAVLVFAVPLLVFVLKPREEQAAHDEPKAAAEDFSFYSENPSEEEFLLYLTEENRVAALTMEEYVTGAVLAEMPASYETEALKAQAVAAHTYAVRRKFLQAGSPDEALHGAYASDDSSKFQAYFSDEQAKDFYGEKYAEYYSKVSSAVGEAMDEILVFGGEPIIAAFHALSDGETKSAEEVWGTAVPYLVTVESEWDKDAPNYTEERLFTEGEVRKILEAEGFLPDENAGGWIASADNGFVVCGQPVGGTELRRMFSLPSSSADFSFDELARQFTVSSFGVGHGVGLSQYGANCMAKEGSTYDEILCHYYPNVKLCNIIKKEQVISGEKSLT